MSQNQCSTCQFFVKFTSKELEIMEEKLIVHGYDDQYFGACVAQWDRQPSLIRRYLKVEIKGCPYYQRGYFVEETDIPCGNCSNGHINIKRPVKNGKNYVLLSCSNFPQCNTYHSSVPIGIECRFCGTELHIKGGEILTCFCPSCKRSVKIPLMISSWPAIFQRGDQCPHRQAWSECPKCSRSMRERKSIIDLELPETLRLWKHLTELNFESPVLVDEDESEHWIDDEMYEMQTYDNDDDYQMEFIDEYINNTEHEVEDGWFYGDDI